MKYEDIKVNFKELSVLTDFSQDNCRNVFKDHLSLKKVGTDIELLLTDLEDYFDPVHTMDERYDKMPQLQFCTIMKPLNYRMWLKDKDMIKAGGFTNGHNVFNKILSEDQLDHATKAFKHNHIHMYGEDSYQNLNK